jgi:hypothetical protein
MLSPRLEAVGSKNASRIWGFISKFVMLDRFSKTLGATEMYPGPPVLRKPCSSQHIGSIRAEQVSIFSNE